MPTVTAHVDCPVYNSFRVQQIAGMFDVPLAERSRESFSVDVPSLAEDWSIGVVVGPSGAGKSTVARAAFGDALYTAGDWPEERAVIDGFVDVPTKTLVATLTAVGFSSPPSWIKPYWALSNGERFRCDLARALLGSRPKPDLGTEMDSFPLTVFDEFTSVVDRTVAKVGSAAVANAIRSGQLAGRFVAVTCHYDVVPWLEPDWVVDMADCSLRWGRLRRPAFELEVVRCAQAHWRLFRRHHYLSGQLPRGATCYAALLHNEPVAFCAITGLYGRVGRKRVSRIVVLPDYQGLGIGMRLVEHVCEHERQRGFRLNITASHPAVIGHCQRSAVWRMVCVKRASGASQQTSHGLPVKTAVGRSVASFEFLGMNGGDSFV